MSERGISNDDAVVLYGGNNNWFAAYAYWYFKHGHDKVLLLDGGRKKWELDARLSSETVTRPATSYTALERTSIFGLSRRGGGGDRHQEPGRCAQPDEYAGRLRPSHLPQEQAPARRSHSTAVNVPWSKAANDDGTFKSDNELKVLYSDAGLNWNKDIIAYCRIGERAHTPGSFCTRSSGSRT